MKPPRKTAPPPKAAVGPLGEPVTLATLPPVGTKRWVARRKAEVLAAVRGGLLSADEACLRYNLTLEEFGGWERSVERSGLKGLQLGYNQPKRARPADPATHPAAAAPDSAATRGFAQAAFDPALLVRLITEDQHQFGILETASPHALQVRLFAPLRVGAVVEVELANGERHRTHCTRSAGDRASLRLFEPVAIARLAHGAPVGDRRRHRRLHPMLHGVLHLGQAVSDITFHDISSHGAAFRTDRWLLIGELVRIETSRLPTITAKVRWRNHPHYGVCFEQEIALDALDRHDAARARPSRAS